LSAEPHLYLLKYEPITKNADTPQFGQALQASTVHEGMKIKKIPAIHGIAGIFCKLTELVR
jgi:hypothetical protein